MDKILNLSLRSWDLFQQLTYFHHTLILNLRSLRHTGQIINALLWIHSHNHDRSGILCVSTFYMHTQGDEENMERYRSGNISNS